jgi:mono/diheme cytochrome c family protein
VKHLFRGILLLTLILIIAACSPASPTALAVSAKPTAANEHGEHGEHSMDGGHTSGGTHIHAEIPADYAKLTNPYSGEAAAIAAGKTIFETNCATCHGPQGYGDGPTAASLNPKPANLSDRQMMKDLSDAYLFWRVSEGGMMVPFNSVMPPWKNTLTEEQRWQVVNYVRTLSQ